MTAATEGRGRGGMLPEACMLSIRRNQETFAVLRALQDCRVIMARGPSAQVRFNRAVKLGFATAKGNRACSTYRLSIRGLKFMGEL